MAVDLKWRKIRRASEWPIAVIAFGSALILLAFRLGALPAFDPAAIWVVAILGIAAGVWTFVFIAGGVAVLWIAHSDQPDPGQRAISVLKAGLKLTTAHGVCRACVGRGFTWRLAPGTRQDGTARLKVECAACGGGGFIDI